MRLTSLKINNITSLKGSHTIHFDSIFQDYDLFAITGATGSGKSSLLSSISLSLYGRHYKSSLAASDFVSQGEREGSIELDFNHNGNDYKATWVCSVLKKDLSRKKNPTPSRSIFKNGELIEDKIEDVIGLTFDQFCKVVILNQGEFSKFLTCSYTERKDILERIARIDDLKGLSKTLNKEISTLEIQIKEKSQGLDKFEIIPHHEAKEFKKTVSTLEKTIAPIEEESKRLHNIKKVLSEIIQASQKYGNCEEGLTKNNKKLVACQDDNNTLLEKVKQIRKKEEKLRKTYEEQKPILIEIKENYSLIEKEDIKLKNNIQSIKNIQKRRSEKEIENQEIEKVLKSLKNDIASLEIAPEMDIEKVKEELKIKREVFFINEQSEALEDSFKSKEKVLLEVENEGKKYSKELELEIDQAKQYIKEKFPFINLELLEFQEKYVEQINSLTNDVTKKIIKHNDLKKKIDKLTLDKKETSEKLNLLEAQYNEKGEDLKALKAQKDESQHLHSKIFLTNEVLKQEDKECPTCLQSIDHVNTEKLQRYIEELESSIQIDSIKLNIEKIESDSQGLSELITSTSNFLSSIKSNIQLLNEQKEQLSTDITSSTFLSNVFSIEEKDSELLGNYSKYLSEKQREFASIETKKNELRIKYREIKKQLDEVKKDFNDKKNDLDNLIQNNNLKSSKISKAELDNIEKTISKFNDFRNINTSIIEKGQTLKSNQEYLKKLLSEEKEVVKLQEVGLKDIDSSKEIINKLCSKLDEQPKDSKDADRILNEREGAIYKLTKDIDNLQLELREGQSQLSKLQTLERTIKEQISDLEKLFHFYLAELKKINNDNDEVKILQKVISLNDLEQLKEHREKLEYFLDDELSQQIYKKDNEYNDSKKSLIELKEKLSLYEKQKVIIANTQKEIDILKYELSNYENLTPLIGQDKFREYALKLIEKQLLSFTNIELKKLCDGRYELISPYANARREFFVIDNWAEGESRKVSTLSGGETFMISLGLALGLSEMNRGHSQVECFFIDEGFGTLDTESINEVLECLYNIQARGKYIGIISHVKELTDRIPLNVHLEKQSTGDSQINLIHH
tara:strand:+ start:36714 stop:39956 length:3243 start_codon:yes stop_codon:yes gene_type:complete